ncbi:MAG: alpha/beta hydrolase [Edaphobacter sp.]
MAAARANEAWSKLCPNTTANSTIGGFPSASSLHPPCPAVATTGILINLHGGGFNADSNSYAESIPIAGYTGIKIIVVLYALAPEHPFPAAIDDAVAVYKEVIKTHKPSHIAVYGTSAGAVLTAEFAVKIKTLGLPMPGALGIFSTVDGFAEPVDSQAIFTFPGLAGHLEPPDGGIRDRYYVGSTDPRDPVLSPIYADLHGLPPTLFLTSGRDAQLSGTANLHRAYLRAGVDARLVLFDALPHAFWYNSALPESIEANHIIADFILKQLAK